jgi:hypothetical protein
MAVLIVLLLVLVYLVFSSVLRKVWFCSRSHHKIRVNAALKKFAGKRIVLCGASTGIGMTMIVQHHVLPTQNRKFDGLTMCAHASHIFLSTLDTFVPCIIQSTHLLGQELALYYARLGARLLLVSRRKEALEKVLNSAPAHFAGRCRLQACWSPGCVRLCSRPVIGAGSSSSTWHPSCSPLELCACHKRCREPFGGH